MRLIAALKQACSTHAKRALSPTLMARGSLVLQSHGAPMGAAVRGFASEAKNDAKDEATQASEARKAEHEDAKVQAKKQASKTKKHAFFASWYLLIAVGCVRWYQKKLKDKNEGSVEREAEASFRRRLTGANANMRN